VSERPGEKSSINPLIENRFPEFLQPTIEWHLLRTFGEQGDPPAEGEGGAACAFRLQRRYCVHARIPCVFFECSFSELVRLRESGPIARHAGISPGRVASRSPRRPARRRLARGDDLPRGKHPINALIKHNFPEFMQPTIEWHSKRTFGEHGALRSGAQACSMREFRVNISECSFSDRQPIPRTFFQCKSCWHRPRQPPAHRAEPFPVRCFRCQARMRGRVRDSSPMIFNDVLGGLLAGGVGGIASGFLGITSGVIQRRSSRRAHHLAKGAGD
jgi:hypothetical protein